MQSSGCTVYDTHHTNSCRSVATEQLRFKCCIATVQAAMEVVGEAVEEEVGELLLGPKNAPDGRRFLAAADASLREQRRQH